MFIVVVLMPNVDILYTFFLFIKKIKITSKFVCDLYIGNGCIIADKLSPVTKRDHSKISGF